MKKLKICMFETYYGGSHKGFADGIRDNTRHDICLYTLPELNYKWRMRGSALHLIENNLDSGFNLLFVSDMFNVADYISLRGKRAVPVITYFHENQITYPINKQHADFGLGMINIVSALSSEINIFNSKTHLDKFIDSIPGFIDRVPDYKPSWVTNKIKEKSRVIYPGCDFDDFEKEISFNKVPLIIWNHRWDYDKKPENFFHLLKKLKDRNIDFNVALLGQNYERKPEAFKKAEYDFKENLVFTGFPEKKEYVNWLKKGDIVISTAIQENFGYSVAEAVNYGCLPLLPDRLSYPELIPERFHEYVLYKSDNELLKKTVDLINNIESMKKIANDLSYSMKEYSWANLIDKYDDLFEKVMDENR